MSTVRLRAGKHRSFAFPLGCSRLVTASVWDYSWVAVGTARICSRTLSIGAGFSRTSETPSVFLCAIANFQFRSVVSILPVRSSRAWCSSPIRVTYSSGLEAGAKIRLKVSFNHPPLLPRWLPATFGSDRKRY
ncbi:hypothetical protein DNTS_018313 [Danionella cerebrum]|uniref:Uncharacterized protein n=1 Tax=Danionella cerebrum TaxID=2873325 RepID=A0A553QEP9_9TELE|nr:hypothetical protein DNTS_018313 [Danionella translucida]